MSFTQIKQYFLYYSLVCLRRTFNRIGMKRSIRQRAARSVSRQLFGPVRKLRKTEIVTGDQMNRPTHQIAGALASLVITQNDNSEKSCVLHHPAAAIPIGAFLGRLPDMIEPAFRNPNHRQFFHSITVLGMLAAEMHKA
jgi:hypothetical protein